MVMSKATIIDDDRKADWDRFVLNHPDAISWHVYDWSKVLRDYYGLAYFPIAVCNGSEVRGVLPLYRVRTLRSGPALISIPYVVAGGIVAEDEQTQQLLLQKAIELSGEMGSIPITLKQYKTRVAGDLRTDAGFYNLELDLSGGVQRVWDDVLEINKELVDSTRHEKLDLEFPSDNVVGFYRTLSRHQHAWGVPTPSRRWIQLLLETGMYSVALLRRGERIVAGTLVKRFQHSASFPLTCLPTRDESQVRFAYRLYWELITQLAAEGTRTFHSGRIPKDDSVPRYRLGWGGNRREYFYQYYGLRGKTETGNKRGRARRFIESTWRRMPRRLANLLSPSIIKEFP